MVSRVLLSDVLGVILWHFKRFLIVSSQKSPFPNHYDILVSRYGLGLSFDISLREFFHPFYCPCWKKS